MDFGELNELYAKDVYKAENTKTVFDFYEKFKDREELIEWAKQMPPSKIKIYEFGKKKQNDIIVVVTTDDIKNKYTKHAIRLYRNFHTIFVESSGPFFNYSNSCNFGLRHAATYKPDWIILSNNDVYEITDLERLRSILRKIDKSRFDTVFIKPDPDFYHSYKINVVKTGRLWDFYRNLCGKDQRRIHYFYKKFNVEYTTAAEKGIKGQIKKIMTKKMVQIVNIGDFSIFSTNFIDESKMLFDTGFIYIDFEDTDLSFRLFKRKRFVSIDFMIGSERGATLGTDIKRRARDIANAVYLDYKLKKELKSPFYK